MIMKRPIIFFALFFCFAFIMMPLAHAEYNSSTDCQSFMEALNDFPLGGRFEKTDYLLSDGSDISDSLWILKGYIDKNKVKVSVSKDDSVSRQLEFTINSKDDFCTEILATINNLYRQPTAKNITPTEKRYVWQYDNYKAVLTSKARDNFTYDITFVADWNYLSRFSSVTADGSEVCKGFIKAINDLPLQKQFNKPNYLLANGSDIASSFWFYKGNLGQNKIDVRVRQSDLLTRKVEISSNTADDFASDLVFAISNIYYKPTAASVSQTEQKFTWEYFSYKVTFNSKLNENFRYDISFTAECK